MSTKPKSPAFHDWVYKKFSDRFMTELAFLLIPLTLMPLLFTFSAVSLTIFQILNFIIIVIFTLEYILKLIVTKPHWKYALNPWHILDLAIILLAAPDILPFIPLKGWRGSPLLRLLRLFRVFALTGRVVRHVKPVAETMKKEEPSCSIMRMHVLVDGEPAKEASLDEVRTAIRNPQKDWIDLSCITHFDIEPLSDLFSIPANILQSKLLQDNFPGIDFFPGYSAITLWDTKWADRDAPSDVPQIENPRVTIIHSGNYIATLTQFPYFFSDSMDLKIYALPEEPFYTQVLYSIFKRKIEDYKTIFQNLEKKVAELEEITGDTKSPQFLETTFKLKKIIQKQGYNINHFEQVLGQILKNRQCLLGPKEESSAPFIALHSEAETLNDLCLTIRDNVTSLIELQLNRVSFDLNRVMKILAVITCLALVPSIIGGLLGQNLKDQPYNISIHEIFFFVISIMLIGAYIFYRKGWLK